MKRNTIAHLDTGVGKTMIAVMIIKEVAHSLKNQPSQKKLMIFLALTRNLIEQQFEVLRENTDLMVDFYHGAKVGFGKKVDEWDASVWEQETDKNHYGRERLSKQTDSPKVEVGEIDTRAPFQSVKDAANLFGEGAFSGKKTHHQENNKASICQDCRNNENRSTFGAKRTIDDLTNKLQVINAAKEAAIKATEAAKDHAKQLDGGQTNSNNVLTEAAKDHAFYYCPLDATLNVDGRCTRIGN